MSAKSAVTVLRSPSSRVETSMLSGATRTPAATSEAGGVATAEFSLLARAAPHLPQKFEVGGFSALHFGQSFANPFPHFAQKLLVEGLLVPHLVHCTADSEVSGRFALPYIIRSYIIRSQIENSGPLEEVAAADLRALFLFTDVMESLGAGTALRYKSPRSKSCLNG
jgi:hypothetical protein